MDSFEEQVAEYDETPHETDEPSCAKCGAIRDVVEARVRRRRPSVYILACGHREEF